jgi:hypothetical protein
VPESPDAHARPQGVTIAPRFVDGRINMRGMKPIRPRTYS